MTPYHIQKKMFVLIMDSCNISKKNKTRKNVDEFLSNGQAIFFLVTGPKLKSRWITGLGGQKDLKRKKKVLLTLEFRGSVCKAPPRLGSEREAMQLIVFRQPR